MEKQERMLIFDLELKGKIEASCDRCGEPFDLPVKGNEQLIVKFGDEDLQEDDMLVVIPDTSYEFDLSHYLYEMIHLLLPAKRIHGEDENGNSLCDPEMLKHIDEYEEEEKTDPRWDALRKLKDNNQ
jgi:uncharacterized metal-binding protein YceD (DUF177 family)